jgi:hypothetical protein
MKKNFDKNFVIDLTDDAELAFQLQEQEYNNTRHSPIFQEPSHVIPPDTSQDEWMALQLQLEFEQDEERRRKQDYEIEQKKRNLDEQTERSRREEQDMLLAMQLNQEFQNETVLINPHQNPQHFQRNFHQLDNRQNDQGLTMTQILRNSEEARRNRMRELLTIERQPIRQQIFQQRPQQRHPQQHFFIPEDDLDDPEEGLSYEALSRLEDVKVTVRKENIDFVTTKVILKELPKEDPQCGICFVDYEIRDCIRILPCTHKFHSGCIEKWILHEKNTCPICRVEVK